MRHLLSVVVLVGLLCCAMAAGRPSSPQEVPQGAPREGYTADSLRREMLQWADTAPDAVAFRIALDFDDRTTGLPTDSADADSLLRLLAAKDYPPALNYLGFKYFSGVGAPLDTTAGLAMIRRAANLGDLRAYNNLGWLYLNGALGTRDYDQARRWFELASAGGVPTAAATLGDIYRDGLGVAPDTLAADSLYRLAIDRGLGDAQLRLIDLRYPYWQTLPADTLLTLGLRQYTGRGPAVGVVMFRLAADAGNPRAEALLGDAFSTGKGVEYSHRQSLIHFYRAALGGNPSAQFVIAELLDMFPDALLEVPDDALPDTARRIDDPQHWYRLAASHGITDAARATDSLLHLP